MDLQIVNTIIVALVGAFLSYVTLRTDRRVDRLEERLLGRIESGEKRVEGRIGSLEEKLTRRIERLEAGQDAMRSDITQIALAVGARPRTESG